jgi:dipeptidyl aminopeptidase/acylaminoacyl peptidase
MDLVKPDNQKHGRRWSKTKMRSAPYGSWKSPITSDLIVSETIGLGGITIDGDDIYWIEMRPAEAGRNVIVRRTPDGKIQDVTPAPFNVRTRVHEYGGGAYTVAEGKVYFTNFADQRLYIQTLNSQPQPLTPESSGQLRYADIIVDSTRNRLICIREDHKGTEEAVNTLVSINLESESEGQILASGCDFYASPNLSLDGTKLTWITWNHPNLPWDGTQLWMANINADGSLAEPQLIAGGVDESIFQPQWSPDGILYFVSDKSGWWNFYRCNSNREIESLYPMSAEFGLPQWVFGMSTYGFASQDKIICTYTQQGAWYLASLDLTSKELQNIEVPYTDISGIKVSGNSVAFGGASPSQLSALVSLDLETQNLSILKKSSQIELDTGYISVPEAIAFPTENNLTAYAFYYPPTNKDYTAPDSEKPPLLVKSHGGPTAAASSRLSLTVQYWTSRGFAFLDVNYGGSTGYGREYHQRLDGNWGIVDVDDCTNAAKYLASQGKVDPNRLAIAGGSAGGYTTLCALTFRDTFKAGASYYGVSDLEALARDTHKFEARYLDRLVAPYPERKDVYEERSPIHFTDSLSCPVIFFQGLEDKVVPPNQAEMMVDALKAKGLPVAYVPFEGEQHGFRRAENIKRALDGEFYFYSRVFGFTPAEAIEPVQIDNLDPKS